MAADVVGDTRLMQLDEVGTLSLMAALRHFADGYRKAGLPG